MGAGDLDHRQFAQQCDLYTGGLHVSPHVAQHHTNMSGYDQGVLFTSHCLDRHLPYMLYLWEDIFTRYVCNAVHRLTHHQDIFNMKLHTSCCCLYATFDLL